MSLKVTYKRGDTREAMLSLSVAPDTTVGDVAKQLFQMDSSRQGTEVFADATLVVTPLSIGPGIAPRPVDAESPFESSGIRSGDHIEVVSGAAAHTSAAAAAAAAVVTVTAGVDSGKTFPLFAGSNVIGRDADVAVKLSDSLASKRHARIIVGDDIEIIDMGSTNGVMIGDTYVTRAQLLPGDTIVIGDTELVVTREKVERATAPTTSSVAYTRSPRVVPALPDDEVEIPAPPSKPQPRQFPRLALIAPVLLGVTMFLVTGRIISLIFIGMSPLLMIGSYFDQKGQQKRNLIKKTAEFDAGLINTEKTITALQETELNARYAQAPSVTEVVDSVSNRGSLIWTRRPEHDSFLRARLGLGTVETSLTVTLPNASDTYPELWDRALAIHQRFNQLDNAPVVVDLRVAGGVGIAGDIRAARAVARGIVGQMVGLHSPMECVVTGFFTAESANHWQWLEWAPHVSAPVSPINGPHLTKARKGAQQLLSQLEALIQSRAGKDIGTLVPSARGMRAEDSKDDVATPTIPAVVVIVENDSPADRRRLIRIAEKGPDVNVHVMWIAPALSEIPAACRSFVEVGDSQDASVGHVRAGGTLRPVNLEPLDVSAATEFARRLSCIEDISVVADDSGDIPPSVSYLDLHGFEAVEPGHHEQRWRSDAALGGSSKRPFTLRALVGHTGDEPFYLDLRSQGPHALVGGTTGAGKSEFLQSWILGMSAAYSPERVTFLFVDYKGGSAFADCVQLPHSVGLVTDLTPHLVDRALASLRAELHFRERLLAAKGAKDLETLEKTGDPETPPSLVIVIDEFAALVNEVPAFVDGVVDIAQRGRSLGLHLIMATQRPAGVIKDNLRANTNLRIALRMADEGDSTDILGIPAAAHVDPGLPGRAMARTGPGRIATFQSAYAGAHSVPGGSSAPRLSVSELALGAGGAWELPASHKPEVPDGEPDAARVVASLRGAATLAEIKEPRRPWLDELSSAYDLKPLTKNSGEHIAIGMMDDPQNQQQRPSYFSPDSDGNLVIFGASGAGKTAALRTIAASATLTRDIAPVHIYGIDGGNGGLDLLMPLPNVGAVIDIEDAERMGRLLRSLEAIIDERAGRFGAARAANLSEYRKITKDRGEARILVLIDGFGAVQDSYMNEMGRTHIFDSLKRVASEGRSVGVNVVVTADRVGALHSSVQALMTRTIVLRLVDENQYAFLGLRRSPLNQDSPAGRSVDLSTGKELQIALLGGDPSVQAQANAIELLAEKIPAREEWVAPPVPRMPELVLASTLPDAVDGLPVIGIESETLEPIGADVTRPFMIAGQGGTGRTNTLRWLCSRIHAIHPERRLVLITQRQTELSLDSWWHATATNVGEATEMMPELTKELEKPAKGERQYVIVIESLQDVTGSPADMAIVNAVKLAKRNGHMVIGEAETSAWSSGMLANEIKSARRGIVMAPDQQDGLMLMGAQFPRVRRVDMPPGRGIYVENGKPLIVQVPLMDG